MYKLIFIAYAETYFIFAYLFSSISACGVYPNRALCISAIIFFLNYEMEFKCECAYLLG